MHRVYIRISSVCQIKHQKQLHKRGHFKVLPDRFFQIFPKIWKIRFDQNAGDPHNRPEFQGN